MSNGKQKPIRIAVLNDGAYRRACYEGRFLPTRDDVVPISAEFTNIAALRAYVERAVMALNDDENFDPRGSQVGRVYTQHCMLPRVMPHTVRAVWLTSSDGAPIRPLADVFDMPAIEATEPIEGEQLTLALEDASDAEAWHVRVDGRPLTCSFSNKELLVELVDRARWFFLAGHRDHGRFGRRVTYTVQNGNVRVCSVDELLSTVDAERRAERERERKCQVRRAAARQPASWDDVVKPVELAQTPAPTPALKPSNESTAREKPASVEQDVNAHVFRFLEDPSPERDTRDTLQRVVDDLPDDYAWTNQPWPGSQGWYEREALEGQRARARHRR